MRTIFWLLAHIAMMKNGRRLTGYWAKEKRVTAVQVSRIKWTRVFPEIFFAMFENNFNNQDLYLVPLHKVGKLWKIKKLNWVLDSDNIQKDNA